MNEILPTSGFTAPNLPVSTTRGTGQPLCAFPTRTLDRPPHFSSDSTGPKHRTKRDKKNCHGQPLVEINFYTNSTGALYFPLRSRTTKTRYKPSQKQKNISGQPKHGCDRRTPCRAQQRSPTQRTTTTPEAACGSGHIRFLFLLRPARHLVFRSNLGVT